MVKRTVELYECDQCGKEGQRYTISFPDNTTRILDRCGTHGKNLEALRDAPGEWVAPRSSKTSFRKSSPEDIRLAIARARDEGATA